MIVSWPIGSSESDHEKPQKNTKRLEFDKSETSLHTDSENLLIVCEDGHPHWSNEVLSEQESVT